MRAFLTYSYLVWRVALTWKRAASTWIRVFLTLSWKSFTLTWKRVIQEESDPSCYWLLTTLTGKLVTDT
jgi:hypothetical protein